MSDLANHLSFDVHELDDELPELERRMRNWARWRAGGMSIGRSMAYDAMASVLRGGTPEISSLPIIVIEAEQIETVIKGLAMAWQRALVEWWCHGGTVDQKARRCGCRRATLYKRLELAHRSIWNTIS